MTRAAPILLACAAGVLLAGCGSFHVDDHPFGAPAGSTFGAADPAAVDAGEAPSHGARLARLLHLPEDRPFGPAGVVYGPYGAVTPGRKGAPPCRYGGRRCPPWERAWPAQSGVVVADRVTAEGRVIPARKSVAAATAPAQAVP